jgi:hypothetical protein
MKTPKHDQSRKTEEGEVSGHDAEESKASLPRWVKRTLLGLVSALVVVVVALLLFERRWFEPPAQEGDSYSYAAVGHRAFFSLLHARKLSPLRYRKEEGLASISAPLFLIMPMYPHFFDDGFQKIFQEIRKNITSKREDQLEPDVRIAKGIEARLSLGYDTVLILPKWRIERERDVIRPVLLTPASLDRYLKRLLPATIPAPTVQQDDQRGEKEWKDAQGQSLQIASNFMQTLKLPEGWSSWGDNREKALIAFYQAASSSKDREAGAKEQQGDRSWSEKPEEKAKEKKRGRLWVIADGDIISNYNLHRGDHAYLMVRWIEQALRADTVVLDEGSHGHAQSLSLRDEMGRFPTIFLSIHACLLLLLLAWHGAYRFGEPLSVRPHPLRGPKEIVAITANVFVHGKKREKLVADYLICVLTDIAKLLNLQERSMRARCEAIDAWCERHGLAKEAVELYRQAARWQEHAKNKRDLLPTAERAWAYRKAIAKSRWQVRSSTQSAQTKEG